MTELPVRVAAKGGNSPLSGSRTPRPEPRAWLLQAELSLDRSDLRYPPKNGIPTARPT